MPMWLAWAKFYDRFAAAAQAPSAELVAQMRQALAEIDATGARNNLTFHLGMLAEVHGLMGEPVKGLEAIDDALALVETTDEHWWESEIWRVKGELLLMRGGDRLAEAAACFDKAAAVAQSQSAKSLELRAVMSSARLAQRNGATGTACARLSAICGAFRDQAETLDIVAAKNLLRELGAENRR